MSIARRFLPSTSLLSAFEAAARTGSVTQAAFELNLTQSAVSRQIKLLEEQLGVALFIRERQTIRLTAGGDAYAREIRDALRKISTASLNLRTNPNGGTLNLAILPTFGTRWLAPRLPKFLAANPGITINLATRLTVFDFRAEPLDAAIHFGGVDWPGGEMVFLRNEVVVPVCSPALLLKESFSRAEDLKSVQLLQITTRPDHWDRWFQTNGVAPGGARAMLFDQFATVAQAAIAGIGVALLPTFLVEEELQTNKLVPALALPMESVERYYLVWPADRATFPPLKAFRDWLVAEAGSTAS